MIFAIVLAMRPISAQKRGKKQRFQQAIRDAAIDQVGKAKLPLLDGQLYARITWFHAVYPQLDVDNIAKPILDALVGVVYDDDNRIAQCVITRIDTRQDSKLPDIHPLPDILEKLYQFIRVEKQKHVLYIEIGQHSEPKIVFGPIDGGST